MDRLTKIRKHWNDDRLLALPGVSPAQSQNAQDIFDMVVASDPTKNYKYVAWCLDAWESGGLLLEDIKSGKQSKTAKTLADFEKYKKRIGNRRFDETSRTTDDRSLLKYKTPGDLYKAVRTWVIAEQEYGEDESSREQKRIDMAKARLESYSLTHENGVKIECPITLYASMILGRNTKWCTAAIKDNMFDEYAETGPLMIVTLPTGERYQAHAIINSRYEENEEDEWGDIHNPRQECQDDDLEEAFGVPSINDFSTTLAWMLLSRSEFKANEENGELPSDYMDHEKGIVNRLLEEMNFMDEADNQIGPDDSSILSQHGKSVSELIVDTIMKSSRIYKNKTPQEIETLEDIKETFIELMTEYIWDKTYNHREPKPHRFQPNNQEAVSHDTSSIMNKLIGTGAIVKTEGVYTLNIKPDETLENYIKRTNDSLHQGYNQDAQEFYNTLYQKASLSDRQYAEMSSLTTNPYLSYNYNSKPNMSLGLLYLKIKNDIEKGISFDMNKDILPNHTFWRFAPQGFIGDILKNSDKLPILKDEFQNKNLYKLYNIYLDRTSDGLISKVLEIEYQRLHSLPLSDSEKLMEFDKLVVFAVRQKSSSLRKQDIQDIIDKRASLSNSEDPTEFLHNLSQRVTSGNLTQSDKTTKFAEVYRVVSPFLGLEDSNSLINRIVTDLDNGELSEQSTRVLSTIIQAKGAIPELEYSRFPIRYQNTIFMLSNISPEDEFHDSTHYQKTMPGSQPGHTFYFEFMEQKLLDISVASAFCAKPGKDLISRLTSLKEDVLSGRDVKPFIIEDMKIEAVTTEEKHNQYARKALDIVHDEGLITGGVYSDMFVEVSPLDTKISTMKHNRDAMEKDTMEKSDSNGPTLIP